MTLTFTGYDQSPECKAFLAKVRQAQGWCNARYPKGHNATVELTAFVPEQPELPCTARNLTAINQTNGNVSTRAEQETPPTP